MTILTKVRTVTFVDSYGAIGGEVDDHCNLGNDKTSFCYKSERRLPVLERYVVYV